VPERAASFVSGTIAQGLMSGVGGAGSDGTLGAPGGGRGAVSNFFCPGSGGSDAPEAAGGTGGAGMSIDLLSEVVVGAGADGSGGGTAALGVGGTGGTGGGTPTPGAGGTGGAGGATAGAEGAGGTGGRLGASSRGDTGLTVTPPAGGVVVGLTVTGGMGGTRGASGAAVTAGTGAGGGTFSTGGGTTRPASKEPSELREGVFTVVVGSSPPGATIEPRPALGPAYGSRGAVPDVVVEVGRLGGASPKPGVPPAGRMPLLGGRPPAVVGGRVVVEAIPDVGVRAPAEAIGMASFRVLAPIVCWGVHPVSDSPVRQAPTRPRKGFLPIGSSPIPAKRLGTPRRTSCATGHQSGRDCTDRPRPGQEEDRAPAGTHGLGWLSRPAGPTIEGVLYIPGAFLLPEFPLGAS
jgi:hypothetical protein